MKNRSAVSDLIFVLIIIFLAFASVISYLRVTKQNDTAFLVLHNNLVRNKLGELLTYTRESVKNFEDIILKTDSSVRNSLRSDSSEIAMRSQYIDSLTVGESGEHGRIVEINSLHKRWDETLRNERTISMSENKAAQDFIASGQIYITRVQELISEMRHAEDDILYAKVLARDRSAFLTPLYSLLLSFLAITFVTLIYFRLRHETRLRVKAEDAQALIHNFFEQVPASLAILRGPEHIFDFTNPSYRELIGARNPLNQTVRQALPELAGQGYFELLDSVYKTGEPYVGREMPVLLEAEQNTKQVYLDFIYQPYKNVTGKINGIMVFCYDVSEQVLARNLIRDAENRSRLAIDAARMGTFDWNLQDQHFISSPRLIEIFGYQDVKNTSHEDLLNRFHPGDKPARDKAVNDSFTTGSLSYEARIIWPNGSLHWITVYGKILADDERNILRMYGMAIDITSQKIALDEIKESEAKFRLLANAMPQQIWTADKNGNLNYFNQAVYDYSGYNFSDIENKGWLSIVHPDDREENIGKWIHSVQTGNEFNFEHRFKNSKGEYRWQLSRAIPQKDELGKIQMWIGTSTDIQDQKHFMQELEEKVFERTESLNKSNLALEDSVAELEQSNAELASFNYIASHDLQEPLRKIIAFSKRIEDLELGGLSSTAKDYFNRIIHATTRMQNLIDAFLSYSQATNIAASMESVDLNKIFREVKNDFADKIEQQNISLESESLPIIAGISLQISQVFTNLIGNAIKFSKTGIDPKIEVLVEKCKGDTLLFEGVDEHYEYWKISIKDNGIGFDQVYENQIFELFQRLHNRQEYAGTGIGLAICKKIMRNHKGFISATGTNSAGATFSMYFPV